LQRAYETVVNLFGEDLIDLDEAWREAGLADSFCRTDSHWSPEGSRLAAIAIADHCGCLAPESKRPYLLLDLGELTVPGDLFQFAGISMHRLGKDTFERYVATELKLLQPMVVKAVFDGVPPNLQGFDEYGPEPRVDAPVLLLGTSYCATRLFEGFVAHYSDRQIRVEAVRGGSLMGALRPALARMKENPNLVPKTWVWEFPIQHLFVRESELKIAEALNAPK
jgi:hypothetical protein